MIKSFHWTEIVGRAYSGLMTYKLAIGDRQYSSWSLRGWLMFDAFDIDHQTQVVDLYSNNFQRQMAKDFAPARQVPAMMLPDGGVIWDSLAMGEELASRHPDKPLWPTDPNLRGLGRSLAAEMHAGLMGLRSECPMNLGKAYISFTVSDAVAADLQRLEMIWSHAFGYHDGPWLCGDYSLADVFYAPVAARIATYDLPVSQTAQGYVDQHLNHPSFRRWRAMSHAAKSAQDEYVMSLNTRNWPGPEIEPALRLDGDHSASSENSTCPYSGKPVTDFLEFRGKVYGFCNPFCRDKTLFDPFAWPKFTALYQS